MEKGLEVIEEQCSDYCKQGGNCHHHSPVLLAANARPPNEGENAKGKYRHNEDDCARFARLLNCPGRFILRLCSTAIRGDVTSQNVGYQGAFNIFFSRAG